MSVLGVIITLSGATLLIMEFALMVLPPNPTHIQRIRHAFWNLL